jgi:hypothetical protein
MVVLTLAVGSRQTVRFIPDACIAARRCRYGPSFDLGEPERYRKDVRNAGGLRTRRGTLPLDTKPDEIAALVREFMKTQK